MNQILSQKNLDNISETFSLYQWDEKEEEEKNKKK